MIELPKNDEALVAVLDGLMAKAKLWARPYHIRWLTSLYWMRGLRNLRIDFGSGRVEFNLKDQRNLDGTVKFTYERIIPKFQTELGRLYRMDTRPAVEPLNLGLDNIRKAAMARVELEFLTAGFDHDALKHQVAYNAVLFGTFGVGLWVDSREDGNLGPQAPALKAVLESIPPWELYPIPPNPEAQEHVEGFVRRRWVPLAWLKGRPGLKLPRSEQDAKLEVRYASFGDSPRQVALAGATDSAANSPVAYNAAEPSRASTGGGQDKTETAYVLLEEVFLFHDQKDLLARWIVKVGKHIADDKSYPDKDRYCPIGIGRYHPIGAFFGRSWVEPLISVNSETEQLVQRFLANIKDLDNFGIMLLPTTWGVPKKNLLEGRGTKRVEFYEPDYTAPDADVKHIEPQNPTDIPGRAIVQLERMMDDLAQISDLFAGDAPGRTESAASLQLLHETSSVPLSVPANHIASAFVQVYKALLAEAPTLLDARKDLPLFGLDDNLLGLQIDQTGQNVQLDATLFPMPHEVKVAVRDQLPINPSIRKRELLEALQAQVIDVPAFRIICWSEGIDYPTGAWAEKEAFRKAMLQCLYLFGDGQAPGINLIASSESDMFDVHLAVIQRFMAKPEFTFASQQVRAAFVQLKQTYLAFKGGQYPMPMYPEDAAAMAQGEMMGGMGGGMPGMPGMPGQAPQMGMPGMDMGGGMGGGMPPMPGSGEMSGEMMGGLAGAGMLPGM